MLTLITIVVVTSRVILNEGRSDLTREEVENIGGLKPVLLVFGVFFFEVGVMGWQISDWF